MLRTTCLLFAGWFRRSSMGWTLSLVAAVDSSPVLFIPTVTSSDFGASFSVDDMLFGVTS